MIGTFDPDDAVIALGCNIVAQQRGKRGDAGAMRRALVRDLAGRVEIIEVCDRHRDRRSGRPGCRRQ